MQDAVIGPDGARTRWVEIAGVTDAELIGHSMGGTVTIALAGRRQNLVSRLILAEATLDRCPTCAGQRRFTTFTEAEFSSGGSPGSLTRSGSCGSRPCALPIPSHCTATQWDYALGRTRRPASF